jgi:hypothetical protein
MVTSAPSSIPVQSRTQTTGPAKIKAPEQLRQAAQTNTALLNRSDKIAALEGAVDPSIKSELADWGGSDIAELQKSEAVDGSGVMRITDQPPVVGINPRFKRPPR